MENTHSRALGFTAYPISTEGDDMRNALIFDGAGNVAIICSEGVFNWADSDGNAHIYTWYGTRNVKVSELAGAHNPANAMELASFIRVFGSRLDSNHYRATAWMSVDNTDEINASDWTVAEIVDGAMTHPYTRMTLAEARENVASQIEGTAYVIRWDDVPRDIDVCDECGEPVDYCMGGHTEQVTEDDAEERFNDMLNDIEPEYHIAGVTILPATILKECDPAAYREAFNNFINSANFTVDGH